jgi:hypothetical protein
MAGVSVTVRDQNNNPIEGAEVTVDACSTLTEQTNVNGVANFVTCDGFGGPFNLQVGAAGYKLQTGQVSKPFWPWQVMSTTVYMQPNPIAPINGTTCPTGYTFDTETGNCIPVASSNYWNNIVDTVKTYATDIAILGAIGLIGYGLYRYSQHRVRAYMPMVANRSR